MPPFALKARAIFPVDQPPILDGILTLDLGQIVAVGKTTDADAIRDLGDVAILPGLVNTHTHLEFSRLSRPLGKPNTPLPDWIRTVLAQRSTRSPEISQTLARGIGESLTAGVTTLGEIATASAHEYPQFEGLHLTLFGEVIGFSQPRSVSALEGFTSWLGSSKASGTTGCGLVSPSASAGGVPRLGISPHAPYTVHPDLVERLVELSAQRQLPLAMHLAESLEELQLLRSNDGPFRDLLDERGMWDPSSIPPGTTPHDYLLRLAKSHRALVIHGNYLDPVQDFPFLAQHSERMSLVYCPRTHAYFGHARYPLSQALAQGVRVALGTDSRASNPDLNLLREVGSLLEQHPAIAPTAALRMATLAGAEALGLAHQTGSLTQGKRADLAVVSLPSGSSFNRCEELLAGIFSERSSPVVSTWLAGHRVSSNAAS